MEAFKKRQLIFLIQLLSVSLFLFGIHTYLLSYLADIINFFFPVWHIYIFHIVVTGIFFTIINYRFSLGKSNVFNVFMLLTLLKMLLAILFLLPLLLSNFENKQPDVFNFFSLYFLYLFFEVYAISKFLQKA